MRDLIERFRAIQHESCANGSWYASRIAGEAADALEAAAEREEKMRVEVRSYGEANHRQALCINLAAGALGPDYSTTIEGLPKACAHMRKRAEKAEARIAELEAGLKSVLDACDQGRMVERGVGGVTIEAQIRRSVIHGVPAWPVEEARALLHPTSETPPVSATSEGAEKP